MRNTRNFDPEAPNAWQMLGFGRGAYGMTCAEIAQQYGISRSQAWRDKRDAVEWLNCRTCDCHLSRNCPRIKRCGSSYPRQMYAQQAAQLVTRLAMAQTQERTPPPPGLGELLRAGRQRRRWTQTQAAEICGITQPYLSQLERGLRCPAWSVAEALAGHLLPGDQQAHDLVVGAAVVGHGRDYVGPGPVTVFGRAIRRVRDIPNQSAQWPHPYLRCL